MVAHLAARPGPRNSRMALVVAAPIVTQARYDVVDARGAARTRIPLRGGAPSAQGAPRAQVRAASRAFLQGRDCHRRSRESRNGLAPRLWAAPRAVAATL